MIDEGKSIGDQILARCPCRMELSLIGYDALHRLTSVTYASDAQSEAFTYDDLGNRISFTRSQELHS